MDEQIQESVYNGIIINASSLDDIWLTQKQIAQMFGKDVRTINHHVIALKKELSGWEGLNLVISKNEITTQHGAIEGKTQTKEVEVYGFDMICQIGYRVNSVEGIKFRQFATQAVREKVDRERTMQLVVMDELKLKSEEWRRVASEYFYKWQSVKYNIEQLDKTFHIKEAMQEYGKVSESTGKVRNKVRRPQVVSGKGRSCPMFEPFGYYQPYLEDLIEDCEEIRRITGC